MRINCFNRGLLTAAVLLACTSQANASTYTYIDLGTLGGTQSRAAAINASGQVVGVSYSPGNAYGRATLWNGTTAIDLSSFLDASTVSAGWVLEEAYDINDYGWIVGNAANKLTGQRHAYVLAVVAIPEPESYAMLLAGLGLLGFVAQVRKANV